MQKIILSALSATLLVCSCNSGTVKEISTTETSKADSTTITSPLPADSTLSGCYLQVYKKDTSNLQIAINGTEVSGPLSYAIFEKDRNDGTFQGEIKGDIISGWYLFRSEGIMSVRQVVWKISNNKLWPAGGEIKMRNDTAFFAEPAQLVYDSTKAFIKVKCIL